jgi:hypothetical protein
MRRMLLRSTVAGLMAASFLALAPAAFAQAVMYKADLKTSAEVPPVDGKGSGTLAATYDPATKKLTYTVNYKDLSVPVNGAVTSPIKGEATLTDAQAKDLADGKWYFNVHTAANKGGEIRGQVMKGM